MNNHSSPLNEKKRGEKQNNYFHFSSILSVIKNFPEPKLVHVLLSCS
jgi:hypothetical protein